MTAPSSTRVVGTRGKRLSAVCQHPGCAKAFEFYPCQKKGDFCSMACRRASSQSTGGTYVRTEETLAKLSASLKTYNSQDGVLAARSETMKTLYQEGKTHLPETNKKTSETMRALHSSLTEEERAEARRKNSEGVSRAWAEGKFSDRKIAIRPRASKQELSLAPLLEPLGYKSTFGHPYYIKCEDKTRVPDYVNVFEKKVLEYFGMFWHPDPLEDILVRKMYEKAGWECTVIWESDLGSFRELLGVNR